MPPPRLPLDVVSLVFERLGDELSEAECHAEGTRLCLVCREWLNEARKLAMRQLTIDFAGDFYQYHAIAKLPHLSALVRVLTVIYVECQVPKEQQNSTMTSFQSLLQACSAVSHLTVMHGDAFALYAPGDMCAARPSVRNLELYIPGRSTWQVLPFLRSFRHYADFDNLKVVFWSDDHIHTADRDSLSINSCHFLGARRCILQLLYSDQPLLASLFRSSVSPADLTRLLITASINAYSTLTPWLSQCGSLENFHFRLEPETAEIDLVHVMRPLAGLTRLKKVTVSISRQTAGPVAQFGPLVSNLPPALSLLVVRGFELDLDSVGHALLSPEDVDGGHAQNRADEAAPKPTSASIIFDDGKGYHHFVRLPGSEQWLHRDVHRAVKV